MMLFLSHEDDYCETIQETIREAKKLDVDMVRATTLAPNCLIVKFQIIAMMLCMCCAGVYRSCAAGVRQCGSATQGQKQTAECDRFRELPFVFFSHYLSQLLPLPLNYYHWNNSYLFHFMSLYIIRFFTHFNRAAGSVRDRKGLSRSFVYSKVKAALAFNTILSYIIIVHTI